MSVIAYDGRIVAADSQLDSNGTKLTMTKLFRHEDTGRIIGAVGDSIVAAEMVWWITRTGADGVEFPEAARSKDGVSPARVFIWENGKAFMYGGGRIGVEVHAPFAMGSGQDAAMAAMLCGRTAAEAVEVACRVDTGCGGPVVSFEVEQQVPYDSGLSPMAVGTATIMVPGMPYPTKADGEAHTIACIKNDPNFCICGASPTTQK